MSTNTERELFEVFIESVAPSIQGILTIREIQLLWMGWCGRAIQSNVSPLTPDSYTFPAYVSAGDISGPAK